MKAVNLSRRPFVNARPVVRVSLFLWILGVLFLGANFWLYGTYWIESADIRNRLAEVESTIRQEEEGLSELDSRFNALDLDDLNEQAAFLNRLIASRTFPWSVLFDHLEEALPRGVKLESVQPSLPDDEDKGRASRRRASRARGARGGAPVYEEVGPSEVQLSLAGTARSGEELLAFVDALYEHPSFREPLLRNERLEVPGTTVRFDLAALYLVSPPSLEPAPADSFDVVATAEGIPGAATAADEPPAAASAKAASAAPANPAAPSAGSVNAGSVNAGSVDAGSVGGEQSGAAAADVSSVAGREASGIGREPAAARSLETSAEPRDDSPGSRTVEVENASTQPRSAPASQLGTTRERPPASGGATTLTPSADTPSTGISSPPVPPNERRGPRFVTPGASGTPRLGGGGQLQ